VTGQYTLDQTERAVAERLADLPVDHAALAAVSSIYRAAGAVRNHFEREVLTPHGLTWTGWVVLWVIWVWERIESRHVASEAGISKSTLTGVVSTLEGRSLVRRSNHPDDGRRVLLSLTPQGHQLMNTVFPALNARETAVMSALSASDRDQLTASLRGIVLHIEQEPGNDPPVTATVVGSRISGAGPTRRTAR
jgi:MarR family transcriptional regulator, organic hydroperoxide resistance regulator